MARLPDAGYDIKPGQCRLIRRQHCKRCDTVLAIQLENECWWLKDGIWRKERWYGNHTRCPNCGIEGTLPIDKPLMYEMGKVAKEVLR